MPISPRTAGPPTRYTWACTAMTGAAGTPDTRAQAAGSADGRRFRYFISTAGSPPDCSRYDMWSAPGEWAQNWPALEGVYAGYSCGARPCKRIYDSVIQGFLEQDRLPQRR